MEKNTLKFKENELTEAEDYYNQLHISRKQRRKILTLSKLATKYIPINEMAMCGFAFKGLKEYQVDNKIEMISFETMSAEAKIEMLRDVMERVKNMLARIIIKEDQAHNLDRAVRELLEFYKNNLI